MTRDVRKKKGEGHPSWGLQTGKKKKNGRALRNFKGYRCGWGKGEREQRQRETTETQKNPIKTSRRGKFK